MTDSKPPSNSEDRQDEKWHERPRVQMAIAGTIIVACLLVLGFVLDLYIAPTKPTHRKDVAQALGLIAAGGAGAYGIYFTWRNQKLARQSQEQNQKSTEAQLQNAQEELRLTRQGQITERFTRAIDQLGSEKLEIRLGGIYALERIDKEFPERAYHGTVMEVLTAYVRENSRWDPELQDLRDLPSDILAILDVLNRREEEDVPEAHRVLILNLRQANLQGAHLEGAFLQGAFLQLANLQEARLQYANLQVANLEDANLEDANLEDANLEGAFLQGAFLQLANLQGANLQYAHFRGANLQGANLQGAFLQQAHLQGATGMAQDQIEWTIGSSETELPEDLNRPELWSKSLEEQERIVREALGD